MLQLNAQLSIFEALKKVTSFSDNQDKTCSSSDLNDNYCSETSLDLFWHRSTILPCKWGNSLLQQFSKKTWIISPPWKFWVLTSQEQISTRVVFSFCDPVSWNTPEPRTHTCNSFNKTDDFNLVFFFYKQGFRVLKVLNNTFSPFQHWQKLTTRCIYPNSFYTLESSWWTVQLTGWLLSKTFLTCRLQRLPADMDYN